MLEFVLKNKRDLPKRYLVQILRAKKSKIVRFLYFGKSKYTKRCNFARAENNFEFALKGIEFCFKQQISISSKAIVVLLVFLIKAGITKQTLH